MKKLALVLLSICCFQSQTHAWWGQFEQYKDMEKADKRLWESQVHDLMDNPSVSKERTWIKYLIDRKDQSPELFGHFHTILQEEYFKCWRRSRRVQLSRLISLTEGITAEMDTEALLRLRKNLPTPPSVTKKIVALASLGAIAAGAYYLWQDRYGQEEPTNN